MKTREHKTKAILLEKGKCPKCGMLGRIRLKYSLFADGRITDRYIQVDHMLSSDHNKHFKSCYICMLNEEYSIKYKDKISLLETMVIKNE